MDRAAKLRTLLREYRKARGLTQSILAQRIGMPRLTYRRIEVNSQNIQLEDLDAICAALDLDPIALLHEAGYTAFKKEVP